MAKKPHRSFENDGKETTKERTLRRVIKEKDREIARLKSELKTLNDYFKKTASFVSTKSKALSVEDLIDAADKNQTLEEAIEDKATCPNCESPDTFKGKIPSGHLFICRACNYREVIKNAEEKESL